MSKRGCSRQSVSGGGLNINGEAMAAEGMQKPIGKTIAAIGIYSLIHPVVDMACAVLFTSLSVREGSVTTKAVLIVLLYDFFAFALQFPVGLAADRWNRNALVSAAGCVLVAAGFALWPFAFPACIIAGIGNAMFHVGGGIDVLNLSEGKASPSGISIATGAMGLFLGVNYAQNGMVRALAVGLLLISACALSLLYRAVRTVPQFSNAPCRSILSRPAIPERVQMIMCCLLITVCIRGCLGLVMQLPWKNSFETGLFATSAVVLGKACGGILADRFGWERTSVGSLVVAAGLFGFGYRSMACGLLALFLFNITMPVTLTAMGNLFPKRKGAAFGLTSAALFFGSAPAFFGGMGEGLTGQKGILMGTIASVIALWLGLRVYREQIKVQASECDFQRKMSDKLTQ